MTLTEIAAGVFRHVDTCNVYVLRSAERTWLIDAGDGSVVDALAAAGVHRVDRVLMTHHHRDQAQGLARIVSETGAEVWVPEAEADLFRRVERHWRGRELLANYNMREDRFSILQSVDVAGVLRDYDALDSPIGPLAVLPTPGHTPGSVTFVARDSGLAFTGDLITRGGRLWSLAATQWSYNGAEGLPHTAASLRTLSEQEPTTLLPSHGAAVVDPASEIALLTERLHSFMGIRGDVPITTLWTREGSPPGPGPGDMGLHVRELLERPYVEVSDHLLWNRAAAANFFVLRSGSGKALLFDFGFDFFPTEGPAGADHAAWRPTAVTIPTLKRDFGVDTIDVVVPTHYHDDHVAGINLLRRTEGTQVWAADLLVAILERPHDHDLPCLWYEPIPVDRSLALGEDIAWEEHTLRLHHIPGHTYWAVAIELTVDAERVLIIGDQYSGWSSKSAQPDGLNYVYNGGFRLGDYTASAELIARLQPTIVLTGHSEPFRVTPDYLATIRELGDRVDRAHRELLDPFAAARLEHPRLARIVPYQLFAAPGERPEVIVELTNPLDQACEARLVVSATDDIGLEPSEQRLALPAGGSGAATFALDLSAASPRVDRARLCVDVTLDGRRLGQIAESVVSIDDR